MRAREPKLLLVEDNDLDAEKIVRAFARLGVTRPLLRARDGLEALAILRRDESGGTLAARHVVLLDLNLPRMNGFEFLDELRADSELGTTAVFVLTTSARDADIAAAYRRHVAGYLVKPPTMPEMLETLRVASEFWALCRLPRPGA